MFSPKGKSSMLYFHSESPANTQNISNEEISLVFSFLLLDIRKGQVDVPLKFNALDTSYNTDRKSYVGEYELLQGVPR